MTESPARLCRSDHQDSEAPINHQTHLELYASYIYLAVSCCFDPDGVALAQMGTHESGMAKYPPYKHTLGDRDTES
ncbi:hypothetical protein J1605_005852 [Eschrichtius robustus]|uniref:Uncharacterized protein n=1 Tax=Eschrichtius robustus TaxID=9764 RepID=A0AB34H887_ESCRO|nr:hypothetical protein J1605_005852 [Eschrichtius robustus]